MRILHLILTIVFLASCTAKTSQTTDDSSENSDSTNSGGSISSTSQAGSNDFAIGQFSASANSTAITVTFTLGADVSPYQSVRLTRVAGSTAPSDCSVGSVVHDLSPLTNNATIIVTDNGLSVASNYSYRLCYQRIGSSAYESNENLEVNAIKTGIIQPFCDTPPCAPPQGAVSDRTFGSQFSFSTARDTRGVIVTDFNGDNEPDILFSHKAVDTTNNNETPVELWLKSGSTWSYSTAIGNDGNQFQPSLAVAGDLDNDGRMDAVVTPWLGGGGSLAHYGDGSGGFSSNVNFESNPASYWYPKLADLNGDDYLDIVAAKDGMVSMYLNDQDQTFTKVGTERGANTNSPTVLIGDFDKDGDQDIIQVPFIGNVNWIESNGNGTFEAHSSLGSATNQTACAASGDIDGDGNDDIFFVQYTEKARIMKGNGNGTFGASTEITADEASDQYYGACAIADLDGDGNMDLIMGNGGVHVLWGDGTMNPGLKTTVWTQDTTEEVHDFKVVDLNGDDILDMVLGIESGNQFDRVIYGNAL